MRLPAWITTPLANCLIGLLQAGKLAPHRYGDIQSADGSLYMARGWLVKPHWWTLGWSARVHHTVRSDADRHLHDHPWPNISVILKGVYIEHMPAWPNDSNVVGGFGFGLTDREVTYGMLRRPGDVVKRSAIARHRLEVPFVDAGCYSLFIMGPWEQVWGFYTKMGKVEWRTYLGLPPKGEGEDY